MAVKLLPCPFCGSQNVEADSRQAYRALVGGLIGHAAAVNCCECDAEMLRCYADMPDVPRDDVMADLIETWNRRTLSAPEASGADYVMVPHRAIRALHLALGLNPDELNTDALLAKVCALLARLNPAPPTSGVAASLGAALRRFVADAEPVDLGGGDAVVTTCESLELAKAALSTFATPADESGRDFTEEVGKDGKPTGYFLFEPKEKTP